MDELFILEIYHGGHTHFSLSMRYVGGSFNYYDNYDLDLINYIELKISQRILGIKR